MNLAEVDFTHSSSIQADRDGQGNVVLSTPHERFANPNSLPLKKYGLGPFARLRLTNLPNESGVYAVVRGSNEVLYIGRARDSIAFRWSPNGYSVIHPRNCYRGGQNTNCRINHLIVGELLAGNSLSLWTHTTPEPDALETRLIMTLRPTWNIRGRM